ncbi:MULTISPECIES: Na/Pi cotransporter family protein [Bacillus]|uniref:Na/Pi cotransporter family protein n=1 Tax=Bacillus TaxID=1386 RepID=UPI0015969A95|nr:MULTISPECIES: Na/Pi cotransporter family protein [Bacillus]
MELDVQRIIFEFIGGLGIFLFGIKYMGDGLQKSAGDKLRDILDKTTTNPFMGVLAGIFVTILLQTSTGTTVLTIGLVNAGFMTLRQAIGVIMGANIGTTVTAFIIGIKISDYALPIIAAGAFLLFFFKNKRLQYLGQVVFGFGGLFLGLKIMGDGLKPLTHVQAFHDLTVSMSTNPILGVVIGTVFTVIVQSSSATIGVLQELFGQGALSLQAALPVLFGDNIGTTITAVLASIGASVAARRAALTHVIFNVVGATIIIIIIVPFTILIDNIQQALQLNPQMTIAFAHGIFNVSNVIIQFPFIALLAILVTKLIPGQDSAVEYKANKLDPLFIEQSPSLALGQAKEEVVRMGELSVVGLEETKAYLVNGTPKHAEVGFQLEDAINNMDRKITDYLVKLSSASLSANESEEHSMLMDSVRDIERIGDHFENILELVDYQISNKVKLTDQADQDLDEMFTLTIKTVQEAVEALKTGNKELARDVKLKEDQIDRMERTLRKKHIMRLNDGLCSGQSGIVFVDIISNLERVGDHAVNIAEAVLGESHGTL